MDMKISQMKKEINKAMISKFGRHVDLEALERKILEQMIHSTRQSLKEEQLHKKNETTLKSYNVSLKLNQF